MAFRRFSVWLIIRTAAAMLCFLLLTISISANGYHAASVLLFILLTAQLTELVRYVGKTNEELARFFQAARHADYSQRFDLSSLGSGFDELGLAFGDILKQLQKARNDQEETLRHLKAVVEHVPVPLMSVDSSEHITLWNNSARRLFGTHPVVTLSDLNRFSPDFSTCVSGLVAGQRSLITITIDGVQHQLSIAATSLIVGQHKENLISLQDIQSELDSAQLEAWQELVRVLTHEIMNSITPVASLAKTAVDLVDDVKQQVNKEIQDELNDVTEAVQTVARRSDGLMKFVGSYRKLTRLPEPNKQTIDIKALFTHMAKLVEQSNQQHAINMVYQVTPDSLQLEADSDMLEQVLINLLQNARHAVNHVEQPQISLQASLNNRGHLVMSVTDNGAGIAPEIKDKIFVPFFTTKREGSGVGLALTRQIMLAHQGQVSVKSELGKGSQFVLTF